METSPRVSVVIPTRNRPELVLRAVRSALSQTYKNLEVVVVVDGPDPETVKAVTDLGEFCVRVRHLTESVGGAEARNEGVRTAGGEWIAFLDDDDEWLPSKIERQLEAARASKATFPIVTTRLIARRADSEEVWPRRQRRCGEDMGEYLLCREVSVRQGEGFIQTSTLLVPRELLILLPFTRGLPRHQDWDWLIRVAARPDVSVEWAWNPLTIYHIDEGRQSISRRKDEEPSIDWVKGNALITPKARAYFYATQVAVRCTSIKTFISVVQRTISYPRAFWIAMGLTFAPQSLVSRRRNGMPCHG